jgi:DHA1 family inner membrane transport protein
MTGQSLALVLGVPLATLIGVVGGWRGASVIHALAAGLLALLVWLVVGREPARHRAGGRASGPGQRVLTAPIVAMLGTGIAERVCYAGMAVYLATYLLTSYPIAATDLALALALIALGNVAGNLLGSQLADRLPDRLLLTAAANTGAGLLALPLFLWQPGLTGSIGLGFVYALVNAIGRPALIASLTLAPAAARGTILGMNVSGASIGWLAAAAVGGWLIAAHGFASLGLLSTLMGLSGGALAGLARWLVRQAAHPAPDPPGRPI